MLLTRIGFVLTLSVAVFAQEAPAPAKQRPARPPRPGCEAGRSPAADG